MRKSKRYSMSAAQDKQRKEEIPMWVQFQPYILSVNSLSSFALTFSILFPYTLSNRSALFHCESFHPSNGMRRMRLRISNRYVCVCEYVLFVWNFTISRNQICMYCTRCCYVVVRGCIDIYKFTVWTRRSFSSDWLQWWISFFLSHLSLVRLLCNDFLRSIE